MKILIVLAHPNPGSFNHGIAHAVRDDLQEAGHEVVLHDLCAEGFPALLPADEMLGKGELDPVIAAHCEELGSADGIVVVHPNWWGQPPAILKGWVDRVFRHGLAYRFGENDKGEGVPIGLLKAKAAVVFNTANTPEDREKEIFGDPLENLWQTCIFDFCGVSEFHRRTFTPVIVSTEEERHAWIDEAKGVCRGVFG